MLKGANAGTSGATIHSRQSLSFNVCYFIKVCLAQTNPASATNQNNPGFPCMPFSKFDKYEVQENKPRQDKRCRWKKKYLGRCMRSICQGQGRVLSSLHDLRRRLYIYESPIRRITALLILLAILTWFLAFL
jgi:hypothetical protein